MIRQLKSATGDVVAVATVQTIEPYGDIREYANKLFENHGRGIGEKGKDNGLLVLVAIKEHKVWVEVGYALEQWVTDGFAGETSREVMVPAFRNNQYGAGLRAGTARIIGRIAQGRGVSIEGIDVSQPARGALRTGAFRSGSSPTSFSGSGSSRFSSAAGPGDRPGATGAAGRVGSARRRRRGRRVRRRRRRIRWFRRRRQRRRSGGGGCRRGAASW